MSSKVCFATVGGNVKQGPLDKIRALFEAAGFSEVIGERDLVAFKVHFGEPGNTSRVQPHYIRPIVDEVEKLNGRPFLTDTGCLYFSKRYNARDHLIVAEEHGFNRATAGAPVLIADGLRGSDVIHVQVGLKHFDSIDVAGAIHDAGSMMVITHITGHVLTGFAGTIKNLGMGAAGRRMKMAVHSQVRPSLKEDKCTRCEACLENCPTGAISLEDNLIVFDNDVCYGCGECVAICPEHAIKVMWHGDPREAQEKLAEITKGVLANKQGRAGFWSFLTNITPTCDCWNFSAAPAVADIGFLASLDPVALDQASGDLVIRSLEKQALAEGAGGSSDTFLGAQGESWNRQLAYAEEIGLGSREYELITLED